MNRRQRILQRNRTERLSELLDWQSLGKVCVDACMCVCVDACCECVYMNTSIYWTLVYLYMY